MVAVAKKGPINMAVCLGKKPENTVVVLDKRRKPDALAREAKAAGETTKIAAGIFSVDGKKAKLTCIDKPPSSLGKQLKLFFTAIGQPLTFEVINPDGSIAPEDEGDGQSTAPLARSSNDGQSNESATNEEPTNEIEEEEEEEESSATTDAELEDEEVEQQEDHEEQTDPRLAEWESGWDAVQDRLTAAIAAGGPSTAKLIAVRDLALAKAKALEFGAAIKALGAIVSILDAGTATRTETDAKPKTTTADPKDIVTRLKQTKPVIAELQGPLGDKLRGLYEKLAGQVKSAAYDQAAAGLVQLETALAKIAAARDAKAGNEGNAEQTETETEEVEVTETAHVEEAETVAEHETQKTEEEEEEDLDAARTLREGRELQAEIDRLMPLVARAASSGKVADVNAMTLLFNSIADRVPAPDHARAMAGLARVAAMIEAGQETDRTAFDLDALADDVKPFAKSRIDWSLTRRSLRSELGKLQDSIAQAVAKEPGLEEALPNLGAMFGYLDRLDDRLEAKLGDIVNADDESERAKLKSEARRLLAEYQKELSQPFFQAVDNDNGFVQVSVASSARTALDDLARVLA